MVGIRLRELRREDWRAVAVRLSRSVLPSRSRAARESDHGLPGLAVKKRNGRKLAWGRLLFLKATFVQRMRPRAQL